MTYAIVGGRRNSGSDTPPLLRTSRSSVLLQSQALTQQDALLCGRLTVSSPEGIARYSDHVAGEEP
jgi:hypothetical protein